MEAIVLAGGFGTRLQPMVADIPKPMAPIGKKPFLEILLGLLVRRGFTHLVLSVGFMAEKISDHFGSRFRGVDITYALEDKPLGTGGAIRLAIESCVKDHVFVFNGDTYMDLEVDLLEQQWQAERHLIVVGRQVPDTSRYGRIVANGKRIISFSEKGISGPGLINAGCYVLDKDALENFPQGRPFSIETDYLALEVARATVDVYEAMGVFIDIGLPEDYVRAQRLLTDL